MAGLYSVECHLARSGCGHRTDISPHVLREGCYANSPDMMLHILLAGLLPELCYDADGYGRGD